MVSTSLTSVTLPRCCSVHVSCYPVYIVIIFCQKLMAINNGEVPVEEPKEQETTVNDEEMAERYIQNKQINM